MRTLFLLLPLVTMAACGEVPGPIGPGGSTGLNPDPPLNGQAIGDPAVEPDQANVWVINAHNEESEGAFVAKLTAINSGTGATTVVLDVSADSDSEMIFPAAGRALYSAYSGQTGQYTVLLSTSSLQPVATAQQSGSLSGLTPSPSGRFSLAYDFSVFGASNLPAVRLLDNQHLVTADVPLQSSSLELMAGWEHNSDQLVTISTSVSTSGNGSGGGVSQISRYAVTEGSSGPSFGAPNLQASLTGYAQGLAATSNFVGISPDDHWAVFPMYNTTTGANTLVVLDQTTNSLTEIPGEGPVGFTPNSGTMVAYKYDSSDENTYLLMIDTATWAVTTQPIPTTSDPSFYVAPDGTQVVVSTLLEGSELAIYDSSSQAVTTLPGSAISLEEFVVRPGQNQLWIVSSGLLYQLDLAPSVALKQMSLPSFEVSGLNILPASDTLVLVPPTGGDVYFYSMASTSVVRTVHLPAP